MSDTALTHEVEIRIPLSLERRAELVRWLEASPEANPVDVLRIADIYFCSQSANSFADIEMDEVGSYSLRLRRTVRDGAETVELNTKAITEYGDHSAWDEHEISVHPFAEAEKVLHTLGFKEYFRVEKERTSYSFRGATVNIEDVAGYGFLLEVELLVRAEERTDAKARLHTIVSEMGIDPHKALPKSLTNLLMKERARF